jgi:hypothetical protein
MMNRQRPAKHWPVRHGAHFELRERNPFQLLISGMFFNMSHITPLAIANVQDGRVAIGRRSTVVEAREMRMHVLAHFIGQVNRQQVLQ